MQSQYQLEGGESQGDVMFKSKEMLWELSDDIWHGVLQNHFDTSLATINM